ncbi:hypothetical protein SAMN05428982_2767 [Pseudoxanthomonas sp. CF385]|uniref:SH3 domain-containing protein n=1 Tax=Pseudoxanthomonas sp. CF385 TaxID=1881042 RepID=UPI0008872780|nr:SH3 domain-containing protein [Pseudoxanthomonas sp. CF385]SDQ98885.1 hypothetical protein SAMN05428982_2767 [Pseudoxanthomonas sp. CF385]
MDQTELNRLLNQIDPLRSVRDILTQKNGIAASLNEGKRLRDLAMPTQALQRLAKEQQEHFASLLRINNSFADQFKQMQVVADAMRPSRVLGEAFNSYAKRAASMARLVEDMHAPYESVRKVLLPDHLRISEVVKRFSANTVAEQLATYVLDQATIDELSPEGLDEQLVELSAVLVNVRAAETEGSARLTWEQWLALATTIMTILMFWYQLRDSKAMEERLSRAITTGNSQIETRIETYSQTTEAKLAELTAAIEDLKPSSHAPPSSQYAVIVDVLRIRKKPEGEEIARAYANQIVTVTGKKGRWLRVRYYDFQDARLVEGWCRENQLQLIERVDTK